MATGVGPAATEAGAPVTSDLGGGKGNDVLDVAPGQAGPHLQHEGHHAGRQRGCRRRPRVPVRAACPVPHRPIGRHLCGGRVRI